MSSQPWTDFWKTLKDPVEEKTATEKFEDELVFTTAPPLDLVVGDCISWVPSPMVLSPGCGVVGCGVGCVCTYPGINGSSQGGCITGQCTPIKGFIDPGVTIIVKDDGTAYGRKKQTQGYIDYIDSQLGFDARQLDDDSAALRWDLFSQVIADFNKEEPVEGMCLHLRHEESHDYIHNNLLAMKFKCADCGKEWKDSHLAGYKEYMEKEG